jgi:ribosomal protein S18 acetylase RimI-like enzyme
MAMTMQKKITLVLYSDMFKSAIDHYVIREIQFTGAPQEAVKLSERDKQRHPVLVLADDDVVGFFVLHEGDGPKKYTDHPHTLLLRTFSIDSRYQGQGYGSCAIALLDEFVNRLFPSAEEIVLGVNHNNVPAQKLYLHHGFTDTGRRVIGIHGEQWVLSRTVR